jgi:hypothetical protein
MSSEIQEWQMLQFSNNIVHMFQQHGTKLRGTVREQRAAGREDTWSRLAPTEAVQKIGRRVRTPQMNSPQSVRVSRLEDWQYEDLIEWGDLARILADPRSEVTEHGASALGRRFDRTILTAFDADTFSDIDGGTITPFISECAADIDLSLSQITVEDILEAKKALDDHDVPDENRHIVLDPAGYRQLLSSGRKPNATSADFAKIKALVAGEIDFFCGFNWHKSSLCPSPAPNLFYGYAWHSDAMGISISQDITTEATLRSDLCFATEIKVFACLGATRLQGNGVVRIKINEMG